MSFRSRAFLVGIVLPLLTVACTATRDYVNLNDPQIPKRLNLTAEDWAQVRPLIERRTAEGYAVLDVYWNDGSEWVETKTSRHPGARSGAYFFYRKHDGSWYEVNEAVSWH